MASTASEKIPVHCTWSGLNSIFSSDIKKITILGLEREFFVYPPKEGAIIPKQLSFFSPETPSLEMTIEQIRALRLEAYISQQAGKLETSVKTPETLRSDRTYSLEVSIKNGELVAHLVQDFHQDDMAQFLQEQGERLLALGQEQLQWPSEPCEESTKQQMIENARAMIALAKQILRLANRYK